jgi:hypothetical protein
VTDIELDKETRAAIDALVWRLNNRGDADAEPFAAEFIAALKARGWRPTLARPAPDWHYRSHGEAPSASKPGGAGYLAERTRLFGRPGAGATDEDEDEDGTPP